MANKFMNGFDKSDVSSEEAWELYLFGVNDADLYRQRVEPILANLKKKIKKGTYDETLALKLWRYAADDAAQQYTKEYDARPNRMVRGSSFGVFTVPMRKEVALLMQSHYEDELRYAQNPSADSHGSSTSSDVRSPTSTKTRAHTSGNFTATVTGGAGAGANTSVSIYPTSRKTNPRADGWQKKGRAYYRLKFLIEPPVEGRVMSPDKWLLMYRPSPRVLEAVGAFPSLRGAKDFADTRRLSIEGKYKRRAKNPSARLVHRRKINTKRGYFPNPLKDKIALHFNAGNNTNGNPRRVFVVVNTGGAVVGAYDEGYSGEGAVTKHFPGIAIVGRFNITPAQYRELLKEHKK
jgi:hypothetical protein